MTFQDFESLGCNSGSRHEGDIHLLDVLATRAPENLNLVQRSKARMRLPAGKIGSTAAFFANWGILDGAHMFAPCASAAAKYTANLDSAHRECRANGAMIQSMSAKLDIWTTLSLVRFGKKSFRGIMARQTVFIVQTYIAGRGNQLKADAPMSCKSVEIARRKAERLAETKLGVVAFASSGDQELGEYDDEPMVIFRAGRLPELFGN